MILRCFTALLFVVGALFLVFVATMAWLYVIVAATTQINWTIGAALFVATFWLGSRYREMIATPWILWLALWSYVDDVLIAISRRSPH